MPETDKKNWIMKLENAGQKKMAGHLEKLNPEKSRMLISELEDIDFNLLRELYEKYIVSGEKPAKIDENKTEPPEVIKFTEYFGLKSESAVNAHGIGEQLLREGKVAVFLVAGGQGSRLGFDGPKGAFPVTPVKKKRLFHLFAEKIAALQRKYGAVIPWYIMTSNTNHEATVSIFRENDFFGLNPDNLRFFTQGEIPTLDHDGNLILKSETGIFRNPDGHGGSITALHKSGSIDDMVERGVEEIFYFQVDNPLVRIADPLFIGYHRFKDAEMSAKAVRKKTPSEKVGVFGVENGRIKVIEYSDLPEEQMTARTSDGSLLFGSGSIAIHVIKVSFLRRLLEDRIELPWHRAVKKIPSYFGEIEGNKFEKFVFDAMPHASNCVILEVQRHHEFSPVKNRTGDSSPESGISAQNEMFASWLEEVGVKVPRNSDGKADARIEISPLFAHDEQEFIAKWHSSRHANLIIEKGGRYYIE